MLGWAPGPLLPLSPERGPPGTFTGSAPSLPHSDSLDSIRLPPSGSSASPQGDIWRKRGAHGWEAASRRGHLGAPGVARLKLSSLDFQRDEPTDSSNCLLVTTVTRGRKSSVSLSHQEHGRLRAQLSHRFALNGVTMASCLLSPSRVEDVDVSVRTLPTEGQGVVSGAVAPPDEARTPRGDPSTHLIPSARDGRTPEGGRGSQQRRRAAAEPTATGGDVTARFFALLQRFQVAIRVPGES